MATANHDVTYPLSVKQYEQWLLNNMPHDEQWYYVAYGKKMRIKKERVEWSQ